MSISLPQLSAKLDGLANDLAGRALRDITKAVALEAKDDFLTEVRRDLGGDLAFSGWKGGRYKLGVGFDLISDHEAEFKPRPSGMWSVAESGRTAGSKRVRSRLKTYKTPYGPRTYKRGQMRPYGATKGHDTWSNGVKRVERETPKRVQVQVRKALAKHLSGG